MTDRNLQERIEATLKRLAIPVTVIDREDDSKLSERSMIQHAEGVVFEDHGSKYCIVPKMHIMLACKAGVPAADEILKLASELVATMGSANDSHSETSYDVYRRALRGELTGSELEALSHEHQLPADMKRCVLVFHIVQTDNMRAYDLLKDITPLEDKDVLVDMDRHSVVLVKDMSEEDDLE